MMLPRRAGHVSVNWTFVERRHPGARRKFEKRYPDARLVLIGIAGPRWEFCLARDDKGVEYVMRHGENWKEKKR